MGKATGVFLILAGIATAALVLPSVDQKAEQQVADAVKAATDTLSNSAGKPASSVNDIRSRLGTILAESQAPSRDSGAEARGSASSSGGQPQPVAAPTLKSAPQPVIRTQVALQPRQSDPQQKFELAKDIQRELKRVGCYSGEISGEWNSGTRQAMRDFIDHVNAALPTDEPDHILRTMVQGHPGNACGKPCVGGAQTGRVGNCRPADITAQNTNVRVNGQRPHDVAAAKEQLAAAKPAVPKPAWDTTTVAIATAPTQVDPSSFEGRMSIGAKATPTDGQMAVVVPASGLRPSAPTSPVAPTPPGLIIPGAIAAFETTASAGAPVLMVGQGTAVSSVDTSTLGSVDGLASYDQAGVLAPPAVGQVGQVPGTQGRARNRQDAYKDRASGKFVFPQPSFVGAKGLGDAPPSRAQRSLRWKESVWTDPYHDR